MREHTTRYFQHIATVLSVTPACAVRGATARFALLAVLAVAASPAALANCLPLADPALAAIDRYTDDEPLRAGAEVDAALATARAAHDPAYAAALAAIRGDARAELSDSAGGRAAIATARSRLRDAPAGPGSTRLALRLVLLEAFFAIMDGNSAAAVDASDRMLGSLPSDSLERACTLAVRATADAYLRRSDRAVADGLAAYRIAVAGGWSEARIEAAHVLATVFRRAGLFAQAEHMSDDAIALAKAGHRRSLLSTLEYERGMILVAAGRFAEASAVLADSRTIALELGDRFSAAAVNVGLCWAEISEGRLDAAEITCNSERDDLASGHRADLENVMLGYRARIDLERGRPAAALAKLDAVIAARVHELLPVQEPQFYRDRARALAALGRPAAAYADARHAADLDEAANTLQKNREVAVLSAVLAAEELTASNRVLEERLRRERTALEAQRKERSLWTGLTVTATLIGLLLAGVAWGARRYGNRLRRLQAILHSAGSHAPDALLLLDEARIVRFANRSLWGAGAVHPVGAPFGEGLPADLVAKVRAAIDDAFQRREVVNLAVTLAQNAGPARQFDLSIVPAIDGSKVIGVTLRATDVTDLRRLEREVVDDASRERQELGSELHEGLAQELAGVLFLLGSASAEMKRGRREGARPDAVDLIDQVAEYVTQSIATIRELARGLAPVKIGSGSLRAALDGLVAVSRQRLHVEVSSDCRLGTVTLTDLAADHIYRMCREAVGNAALLGRSTHIGLTLSVDDKELRLVVANIAAPNGDNGFADDFAVQMLAHRARMLGGVLRTDRGVTGGTDAIVTMPLSQISAGAGRGTS